MSSSDSSGNGSDGAERALRERLSGWTPRSGPAADVDGMYAGLQRDLAQERGPRAWLRSRSTPVRLGMALGALSVLLLGILVAWPRADHAVYPAERMAAIALFIAILGTVELVLALWPVQRAQLPPWIGRAAIASGLLGLFALYALPAAHTSHPASVQLPGTPLVAAALPCLLAGLIVALAGYALLRGLDRGGVRRALLSAACAGLGANLALQLHCPVTAPAHMLLGHLGVAVLLVAGVALLHARR